MRSTGARVVTLSRDSSNVITLLNQELEVSGVDWYTLHWLSHVTCSLGCNILYNGVGRFLPGGQNDRMV